MKKSEVIKLIVVNRTQQMPDTGTTAAAFAPANIALCKYWGKRNQELNLPMTSSLSVSLGDKGAATRITITDHDQDIMTLNGAAVPLFSEFGQRLMVFLDLFRLNLYRPPASLRFHVDTTTSVPIAAGLASSACGFAALVLALNKLFHWQLDARHLSILARMGSGSACRSIWPGFVEWEQGQDADGMDSYGKIIPEVWPELCMGLLMVNEKEKNISSRVAMQRTVETSTLYSAWPDKVEQDLADIKQAIHEKDFSLLGKTAESNALAMHGTMLAAWPPVNYCLPETMAAMQKIWALRIEGLSLYFTQDAGPNLKLLFLEQDRATVQSHFNLDIVRPFC